MSIISHQEYGGERPLFASRDLQLQDVTIHAGESALKQCRNIQADHCRFEGKYPFWHVDQFTIRHCLFTPGARAALWYSHDLHMSDTRVEAPKMFREMSDLFLERVQLTDALETLWHCQNVHLSDVDVHHGDYLFLHSSQIRIDRYRQQGNYSFQYCRDAIIRNAVIHSKDAFWNTSNITVYDSVLDGEYLGWHSRNLRLVRCHISGTQPLCYAHNLILEDCTMEPNCDLAFEYSSVQANIRGSITSIKNPGPGHIIADSIGDIIIDEHCEHPGACRISTHDGRNTQPEPGTPRTAPSAAPVSV